MQFIDLNIDVVIEIFRQYLCIDSNGQVILMLVCSTWKEIVTNTPSLWSYITINQEKSGWDTRFAIASSLSKGLPLTIILLDPFPTTSFLKPYVDFIESLIIEFWGPGYPERSFEMVCQRLNMFSGYRGHVGWRHHNTAFYASPFTLYDKMRQVNDASENELLYSYLSGIRTVLITDLSLIGEPTKKVSFNTIWYCVGLLPNLTRLRSATNICRVKPLPSCCIEPSQSRVAQERYRVIEELEETLVQWRRY